MKTPHVHAAKIAEWIEDTSRVVEYRESPIEIWRSTSTPRWIPEFEYRFRNKHQELIDQKAARPELIVERELRDGWTELDGEPMWHEHIKYRLVEPRHTHQDLIDRKKARPELTVEYCAFGKWMPCADLDVQWIPNIKYRLVEPSSKGKKTVKMWQWVIRVIAGTTMTGLFYKSEEDVPRHFDIVQRADWTEIEVEEAA